MNLNEVLTILEESLTREVVTTKNDNDIVSYTSSETHNVKINNDTINNFNRICLKHKNDTISLYVNHTTSINVTKYSISSITSLVIT